MALTLAPAMIYGGSSLSATRLAVEDPNAALQKIVEKVYVAWSTGNRDRFSTANRDLTTLDGTEVTIQIPPVPADGEDSPGFAVDDYKNGSYVLDLDESQLEDIGGDFGWFPSVELDIKTVSGRSYVATNAFGVRRSVKVRASKTFNVALLNVEKQDFKFSQEMEPNHAKALGIRAAIQIKGRIKKLDDWHLGSCSALHTSPTIDDPRDLYSTNCYVGVEVESVSVIDVVKNETLHNFEIKFRDDKIH